MASCSQNVTSTPGILWTNESRQVHLFIGTMATPTREQWRNTPSIYSFDKNSTGPFTLICSSEQITTLCPPVMSGGLAHSFSTSNGAGSGMALRSRMQILITGARCFKWISFAAMHCGTRNIRLIEDVTSEHGRYLPLFIIQTVLFVWFTAQTWQLFGGKSGTGR